MGGLGKEGWSRESVWMYDVRAVLVLPNSVPIGPYLKGNETNVSLPTTICLFK